MALDLAPMILGGRFMLFESWTELMKQAEGWAAVDSNHLPLHYRATSVLNSSTECS